MFIVKVHNGEVTKLITATAFECKWLEEYAIPLENKADLLAFAQKVEKLRKAQGGTGKYFSDLRERLSFIEKTIIY